MTREQFFAKARAERYEWAKSVDNKAVTEFVAYAVSRQSNGARKQK